MNKNFDLLIEKVQNASQSYEKLILIVGHNGTGKTKLLKRYADYTNNLILNFNLALSEKLMLLPAKDWQLSALSISQNLILSCKQEILLLDNLEILFDAQLLLNPVKLLKSVSRNQMIVMTWNGSFENGRLIYARPGHSEYRSETNIDFPVIDLNEQSKA